MLLLALKVLYLVFVGGLSLSVVARVKGLQIFDKKEKNMKDYNSNLTLMSIIFVIF